MTVMSLRGLPVPAERRQQQAAPGTGARPGPGSTTDRRSRGRGPATARSGPECRGGAAPSCRPRPFRTRPGSGPPPGTMPSAKQQRSCRGSSAKTSSRRPRRGRPRRDPTIRAHRDSHRWSPRAWTRTRTRTRTRAEVVLEFEPAAAAVGVQAGAAAPTLAMSAVAWANEGAGQRCHPRRQVVLTPVDEEGQPLTHRCLGGGVRGAIAVEQRLSRGDGVLDVGERVGLDAVHGSPVGVREQGAVWLRRHVRHCRLHGRCGRGDVGRLGRRRPSASRASAGRSRRDHPRSPPPWRRR